MSERVKQSSQQCVADSSAFTLPKLVKNDSKLRVGASSNLTSRPKVIKPTACGKANEISLSMNAPKNALEISFLSRTCFLAR